MWNVIMENLVEIAAAAVITLLGVFGSYLTIKMGQIVELKSINTAQQEVIKMSQQTVGELQQTVVNILKAASADGKLTQEDIYSLSSSLVDITKKKLAAPTVQLLEAAKVDIIALIQGAGEAWIEELKRA